MIPVDNTQTIETAGAPKSIGKVTTTLKNLPFLISALSDRIYKDKPGAIVREYSTNAWDSHILAKLPINELQVSLPTLNDPVLRIRDFGRGLTSDQIRDLYCILGESDKRGSNDLNGQLGLGCKSGFAYGDSFMVTSWVNGEKTIYNIIKGDDHKEGDVLEMARVPMAEGERTGIEVAVPIKVNDLHTIHSKAADLYKYWTVLPTISNMDESELSRMMKFRNEDPFLSGEGWEIRPHSGSYGSGKSVAVMGQVAYPIDWSMLSSKLAITPQKRILLEILQSNDVVLSFPIGSLKFTINREELEYTETTYKNLEDKIEEICTTLDESVKSKFSNAKSLWEAKRIYLSLFGRNLVNNSDDDDDDDSSPSSVDSAIKVLDGEFYRLEETFKGKLVWNGLVIDTPHFAQMNHWDCDRPDAAFDDVTSPYAPCLISYRKKKTRVKRLVCSDGNHNRITPYNGVKVVILDGRYASQATAVARYFLLQPHMNISKVHVLRFANDEQKEKFFAHYNFETAEYVNVSTIIEDVKEWQRLTRKTYGRGGGSGKSAVLKYIDVETGDVKEEAVCLRDLEDGGVYVASRRKHVMPKGQCHLRHYRLAEYVRYIAEYCGGGFDRVYCIPEGKLTAKWFQKAKSEGLWVEVTDYVKENADVSVTDDMKMRYHYNEFVDNTSFCLNRAWMRAIIEKLSGSSSEFQDYADAVVSNPDDFSELTNSCNFFGIEPPSFGKSPVNFKKLLKAISDKYPIIEWMGFGTYDSVNTNKLNALAIYIETVDASKKMLTSVPEPV